MALNQPTTSYQDDYTWPKIMPVKVFNTEYSCTKEEPKKIEFEPTKEFASRNPCKVGEKSPQLVFINICEAKEVNFQTISCGSKQNSCKSPNSLNFHITARPKTAINPNCHLGQFSCEKRNSNPDLTILVNHVNKSKNITNNCKCSKVKAPQIQKPKPCSPQTPTSAPCNHQIPIIEPCNQQVQQPKPCSNQSQQPKPCSHQTQQTKPCNQQVQQPKLCNHDIPKTDPCNPQIQQPKPCSQQVQQPKPCNHQIQRPKTCNNQVQQPKHCSNQSQQPKPCNHQIPKPKPKREAPNAKRHEIKVCPNAKEMLDRKHPPARKLDVKMDPCEAFPDDHWNTTYQEEFGFVD